MPDTAGDVCTDVAVKLNDPSASIYNSTVVLPFVAMAAKELEGILEVNEIPILKQRSSVLSVLALAVELASYPVDFVEPISIEERDAGSTDLFTEMVESEWEPNATPDVDLRYWNFRDGKIKFLGATTPRDIRLKYIRNITVIAAVGTNLEPVGARLFLASRAAQMVEKDVMNSPTKALEREQEVKDNKDMLIRRLVKNKQGVGVRRRPYRGYGRRQIA